jgi:hypothetical protein
MRFTNHAPSDETPQEIAMKRPMLALSATAALLATALPQSAEAAISAPSCAELVKFGQELKPNEVVPINRAQSRFALYAIYASPRSTGTRRT